jgi:hypothetical protein
MLAGNLALAPPPTLSQAVAMALGRMLMRLAEQPPTRVLFGPLRL